MKKFWLIIISLMLTVLAFAQETDSKSIWKPLLTDVKVKHTYSIKYDAMVAKPKFGNDVKALDGKEITIRGFFMPVKMTGNIFVMSYHPMSSCFFCGQAGIESLIEIYPKEEELEYFRNMKVDTYYEAKGTLRLNSKSYDHLIYNMDNVEFIKKIRR